jgi:hypothetical protein
MAGRVPGTPYEYIRQYLSQNEDNEMNNDDAGMAVEAFALRAYRRMFPQPIDRHHPLLAWADYRIAGSETNFVMTKDQVLTTLSGVQHTLRGDTNFSNVELLDDLGEIEYELRESKNLADFGRFVRKASELLSHKGMDR